MMYLVLTYSLLDNLITDTLVISIYSMIMKVNTMLGCYLKMTRTFLKEHSSHFCYGLFCNSTVLPEGRLTDAWSAIVCYNGRMTE